MAALGHASACGMTITDAASLPSSGRLYEFLRQHLRSDLCIGRCVLVLSVTGTWCCILKEAAPESFTVAQRKTSTRCILPGYMPCSFRYSMIEEYINFRDDLSISDSFLPPIPARSRLSAVSAPCSASQPNSEPLLAPAFRESSAQCTFPL